MKFGKYLLLIGMLLCMCLLCDAQGCYDETRGQGVQLYNQQKYSDAIKYFEAARDCPDKPAGDDLSEWIQKCRAAISRQREEQEAREAERRRKAQQLAAQGYLQIRDIQFANTNDTGNIIDNYGATLYASEMKYLKSRILYDGLSDQQQKVTLQIKIYNPDGQLWKSNSSPEGCTFTDDVYVYPGSNNSMTLSGWGNESGGTYSAGLYRMEIWYNGRRLFQKSVTMASKEKAALPTGWLTLLNKAKEHVTFTYDGGIYKGASSNDIRSGLGMYSWKSGGFYCGRWSSGEKSGIGLYIAPEGYHISECKDCSYFIGQWSADIKSGKGTCYDKSGKLIYYGEFADNRPSGTYPMDKGFERYKFQCIKYTGGDWYVGETKDGKRDGYGIYLWTDGNIWYGPWTEDKRDGHGVFLYYNGSIKTGTWKGDTYSAD